MELDYDFMISDFPTVLAGLPKTLVLTFWSMLWALIIAIVFGSVILSRVPVAKQIVVALNTFIKGVPLTVQLLFCYYAVPFVCKWLDSIGVYDFNPRHIPYFPAAVVAIACNFGAYITDVVVSSVKAVDRGQTESAAAVGMTPLQTVVRIILPQATVISIPSMTNYFIWLLKGTSLASIINVAEMLITAQISAADGYQYLEAYVDAAIIYWAVCAAIEFGCDKLYKRVGFFMQPSRA
ncbi:amino acid ABC transporter permease [Bifidobacterium simiarum]|uniref:ABC transporter permease n=1 Tax=Bifidobacterium simiarum TaxID=2045441 RepID=A0A2M9HH28_9BIFI|nr:amino acid ABC transporter permease [Bifidobacterium simiarum]MBT1165372.1 amino acid ABC transporter permease [Bifidobacterium simiarum]PJM76122.1 ABC transporter permease [Bifidobacterium simiarum]